jgi:hypothetical protein
MTGKCTGAAAAATITATCEACNEEFLAPTQELMDKVMSAHLECSPGCKKK